MPREKTIKVRLSDAEYEALKAHADETDRKISEVIRDFIKELRRKPSF
jgi:predicted DNA-binding protein